MVGVVLTGVVWLPCQYINHGIYHCVITIITSSISQDQTAGQPATPHLLRALETGLTGFVPSNWNIWEVPMVWYWYDWPRTMRSVVTPVAHLGTVPLCWGACRGSYIAKYSSHIAADFAFILRIIYDILICSFLNCNLLFCFLESRVTLYLVDCNGRG